MWARASGLSDEQLTSFVIEDDLVEVRAGSTSYGTIGKRPELSWLDHFVI
jgi:hypothetical protein